MVTKRVIRKRNISRNVQYDWKKRGQVDDKVVRRKATAEMRYVSLHHHSTFSYKDGYGLPEDHVLRAAELGMGSLALTEHGNVSSHVKLEQAAEDAGVKPLFGCELYTSPAGIAERTDGNPLGLHRRKNHLTVLAMNELGYRNLLRLVSRSWQEGFHYEPTVTGEMLAEHHEGLIVLSGCTASLLATSLVGGKWIEADQASYKRAKRQAQRFKNLFGDRFYLEVQLFPELWDVCALNEAYEQLSEEIGVSLVATADVHYYEPDQARIRQVLHSIGRGRDIEELGQEWNYDIDNSHPQSDTQVIERLRATGLSKSGAWQALENTNEIAQRCDVRLPRARPLEFPYEGDHKELMREWLREGWRKRGMTKRPKHTQQEYKDRLMYELETIEEKNFGDYFLVVSDMVKFAKRKGIPVGPARGSAAASVLCWLLEITEVDPLRDDIPDLIFERFIDKNRNDLPDIDLDFDDDRREEVKDYMAARYGHDRVSNIGTFTGFKGKNSLDDVGVVYQVPKFKVDQLKNLLIERSSGDLRASVTIEDTVEMFDQAREIVNEHPELMEATLLEGNFKNFGIHAGGLVVSTEPLNDICAVYDRDGKQSVSLDKWDAEYLNLLKIDVLGLSTMGLVRIALEEINMSLDELYALPLDDTETLRGFKENDVVGVFQFDGRATRSVCEAVKPDNFAEIADINALSRPGPLHSGATAEYIDVKHGRLEPPSYHPIVDEITKGTHGCIIYQEQILRIVRELGDFDWTHAAYIRKIISKKLGEQEFNRQWSRFWKGAQTHGVDEDLARRVWNRLITAGAYAFNAAHCVSYGLLAYWTMWLKRHHPQAFYVAALHKYGKHKNAYGMNKGEELLRDTKRHGRNLEVLSPNVRWSGATWSSDGSHIRAGFSQVYGIGDKVARAIVEARVAHPEEFQEWDDLAKIKGIGPKTVEALREFSESEDPFELDLLSKVIRNVTQEIEVGTLSANGVPLPMPTHTSAQVPYERGEDVQVVWLGTLRHRNLKDLFELHYSRTGEELDPDEVRDAHLNEWVVMLGEDDTDILTITVDRWRYPKWKNIVWGVELGRHLVLIRGVKKGFQARRAIYISEMWVIDPED